MISLQKLPQKAIDLITQRLADEQAAFYFYISASAWCRLNGYENASKHFVVESHGEEYHYKRIVNYLSDWHCPVDFPAVKDPIKSFKNLEDILDQGYQMEYELYRKYETNAIEIFPVCQNTYSLMQEFIRMGNDSVIEASNILKKLKNYLETDPDLMLFDKEVFNEYGSLYY